VPEAKPGNEVFVLDIGARPPREGFSRTVERRIRAAEALGVRLVEERDRLAEAFVRLYPDAMRHSGAAYSLPPAALDALARAPDVVALGAELNGSIELVLLYPTTAMRAESFLQAGSTEGRNLAAWLYWQMMERLRAQGVRWLNLGGGVRPGDGIAQLKAWLGGVPRPLHALRLVHDEAAYAALCTAAGADPGGRWFPAYRDPALAVRTDLGDRRGPGSLPARDRVCKFTKNAITP
jgi:hypothetical protein